jgi:pilus assembly protein CpaC
MSARKTIQIALIGALVVGSLTTTASAQGPNGNAGRNAVTSSPPSTTSGTSMITRNLGASPAAPATRTETLELDVGEQKVIPSDNVQSYSEGAKGVVDVRLTKDATQFVVVGLRAGTSTLLFLMTDGSERHYKITINDPNAKKVEQKAPGTVEARDNIRLDFYFVQLSKKSGYQIGVGWPSSVAATASASFDATVGALDSATVVISNQALPRLDMGQSSGWAKVMRQAAVVTANGEKAAVAGGGELNVAIKSAMTTGIQKIPYGSQLEVAPQYDSRSGRIELRLHADVAELDDDQGTGVPGRTTATLDTVVNLEIGQSLILGGLNSKSERSSKSGLPLLSQIPILGVLFGSHSHSEAETENVVVIVPSVVDAVSMQDRARLTKALNRYSEYSGDLEDGSPFVPEAKPGKPAAPAATRAP